MSLLPPEPQPASRWSLAAAFLVVLCAGVLLGQCVGGA